MGVLLSKCADREKARITKPPTCDVYREFPVRALGYAGHLGVCSGFLSPKIILSGQMIATAYILNDVFQKATASANKFESENTTIRRSIDAFLWQLMASVIIPGFILNRARFYTRTLVRRSNKGTCGPPPQYMNMIPCLISLLLIPFIMKPIDNCVDYIMDTTYRKAEIEEAKAKLKIPKRLM